MLKFYFTTVLIWSVIICASLEITLEKIVENGWIELPSNVVSTRMKMFGFWYLFSLFIAMVPIIRIIFVIDDWYTFTVKKEDTKHNGDI